MSTRKFALLLAGALMVPQAAFATEVGAVSSASRTDSFSLPPIPYAETIPWLAHTSQPKIQLPKLGLLLSPATLDFAQVRIEPPNPAAGPLPYLITRPASLKGTP